MAIVVKPKESQPADKPYWISLDRDGRWGEKDEAAFLLKRSGLTEIFDLQSKVFLLQNIFTRGVDVVIEGTIEYIVEKYVIGWRDIVDEEGNKKEFSVDGAKELLESEPQALMDFVMGLMTNIRLVVDEEKKDSGNAPNGSMGETFPTIERENGVSTIVKTDASPEGSPVPEEKPELMESTALV